MILYLNSDAIIHPDNLPDNLDWRDVIRWMLSVMDADDTSLSFVSGCLSFISKPTNDGVLTMRQVRGLEKIFARVRADFINCQLDCQNFEEVA